MFKKLTVVTCFDSGYEALYVDGVLVNQDESIYACDIVEHAADGPVEFVHVIAVMPVSATRYPKTLEQCMEWVPQESSNAQNHRVAAGDVDFSFRVNGNSACILLFCGFWGRL